MRLRPCWMTLALALSALAASPQQPALEGEARRFAQAWARRDGTALESMMRAGGVRLHLLGEEHGSVPPRQGRAALLELMQRHPGGDPRVGRVAAAEGDARKGFAELRVETRAPGALAPVILTVFVGFALEGAGWVVTEVRVLG